jgi:hypothetical protein
MMAMASIYGGLLCLDCSAEEGPLQKTGTVPELKYAFV